MRTHLDLFSGIGGFALACRWNGVRTVGFCEIEPYAQKVIIKNFGAVMADAQCKLAGPGRSKRPEARKETGVVSPKLHSDIFTLNGADYAGVWLVTGGFPCQPFSCAGKRRGKEDDRHLWPEMCRVIAEARPRWVLGENVPGIINLELDSVLSGLENLGYTAWPIVIPACAVDARHRRDRVWIVAHDASQGPQGAAGTGIQRGGNGSSSNGSDMAYANSAGLQASWGSRTGSRAGSGSGAATIGGCGTEAQRLSKPGLGGMASRISSWLDEPDIPRVAHGVKNRVQRLKGLGNAIVPQVAATLIRYMIECHQSPT